MRYLYLFNGLTRSPVSVAISTLEQTLTMHFLALLFLIVTYFSTCILAAKNGMDMNMDQGMSMSMGNSTMYFHFTPGDNLWFLGWAPRTPGAIFGACIGLFLLAIAERWLSAMWAIMDGYWNTRFGPSFLALAVLMYSLYSAQIVLKRYTSVVAKSEECGGSSKSAQPSRGAAIRRVPPFIFAHDVPRAIMRMALASLNFLFMLTVM